MYYLVSGNALLVKCRVHNKQPQTIEQVLEIRNL